MDMSDGMPGTRAPVIAIGAAVIALMTSLAAVIVVVTRSPPEKRDTGPLESRIAAAELVKLKRDSVENVSDAGTVIGVKVTDDKIRVALGLSPADVITNLAGRAIKREFDVYDAVLGASTMDISIIHVDLLRDGKPVHLRWRLDGDLRAARRQPGDPTGIRPRPTDPFGGLSTRDPLLDTIKKLDDLHYEVPRSTLERVVANPDDFSRGARVVPSFQHGMMAGFKLYAIRPGSIFAAIGLQNGDTVRAINGYETDTLEKLQEIYPKIKDAKELAIDITRRGSYELITIAVK